MAITLVIPATDQHDFTKRCIESVYENAEGELEIILIDNGSEERYTKEFTNVPHRTLRESHNRGVLHTFKQGIKAASHDIVCFIHNDTLIHEKGWNVRIEQAFKDDPQLGLAGLLGARALHKDGGRMGVMSHMLGKEYGKCECHDPAALHHGELMTNIAPAAVLDGVGLFFRRSALLKVAARTNVFAADRPLHHWYDRNFSANFLEQGWHVAVIGIQFDHFSGATANTSDSYRKAAEEWAERNGKPIVEDNPDLTMYRIGEEQFIREWSPRLPVGVGPNYEVTWA